MKRVVLAVLIGVSCLGLARAEPRQEAKAPAGQTYANTYDQDYWSERYTSAAGSSLNGTFVVKKPLGRHAGLKEGGGVVCTIEILGGDACLAGDLVFRIKIGKRTLLKETRRPSTQGCTTGPFGSSAQVDLSDFTRNQAVVCTLKTKGSDEVFGEQGGTEIKVSTYGFSTSGPSAS